MSQLAPNTTSHAAAPKALPIADIHLPDAIGIWPPAPGWWLLLVVVLLIIGLAYGLIKYYRQHWAYRKAALSLLDNYQRQYRKDKQAHAYTQAILGLLKRTAMTAYPAHDISALHGKAWVAFLNSQCPKTHFDGPLGQFLADQQYRPIDQTQHAQITDALYQTSKTWIKQHKRDPQCPPQEKPKGQTSC